MYWLKINGGFVLMDKSEVLTKAKQYADLVSKNVHPRKIILYGSYAKGNWSEDSDIDIAVIVGSVKGDFLELETKLYKLKRNIDDRIEPVLLEEDNDRSGFLDTIKEHGYIIYNAS